MGIYSSDIIFGIRLFIFNDDDCSNTLYEKTYTEVMSYTQKREAYLFYTGLNNKKKISFQIYTECSSSHDINNREPFMMWHPITLDMFLKAFGM